MQGESALVRIDPDEDGKDKRPMEARKTKDSTIDRIWKFYHDKKRQQNLTEEENSIRERLEKAWYLMCNHKNLKDTTDQLASLFDVKKSVAYDDVRNAMMLFGDPRDDMKEAKRAIAETMILRGLEKAADAKDWDLYDKFTARYITLNKLDKEEDARMADLLKKQRPVQVVFVTTHAQLKQQAAELMKDIPVVDVDYEDLDETED